MANLAILTCSRRSSVDGEGKPDPWRYLRETLAQIEQEDAPVESRTIVCDGEYGDGPRPEGWDVFEYFREKEAGTNIKGNKLPYFALLSLGAQLGGELVALEDDLIFAGNGLRRMISFPVPADLSWVTFFAPQALTHAQSYPGLWRPPPASSLFCQATKYTRKGLERLMEWQASPEFVQWNESDVALAVACRRLGLRYGAHSPELVQHAGEHSAVAANETLDQWRVSKTWPGPHFDSMQLFRRDDLYR